VELYELNDVEAHPSSCALRHTHLGGKKAIAPVCVKDWILESGFYIQFRSSSQVSNKGTVTEVTSDSRHAHAVLEMSGRKKKEFVE
jgi:hypothetical protein